MVLGINDVATLILKYFTREQAPTMIAIAIAESSLNASAEGDSPSALRNAGYYDSASVAKYWNCPTSSNKTDDTAGASIGLYQIFLGANHDVVMNLSGIHFATIDVGLAFNVPANEADACLLVEWLKNPENNVKAAKAIFDSQGYGAWSVYKYPAGNPVYKQYLAQAEAAIPEVPEEKAEYTYFTQHVSDFAILGLGLTAALMTIFLMQKKQS